MPLMLWKQMEKVSLEIRSAHDARFVKCLLKTTDRAFLEDIQQKIFDPFFTTKEMGKGSGLGLDVVSRIMNQHNGDVKVKSEPGATEFEICFPAN
jgi:nitrogen-specific signal transduction histidine kinase